MCQGWLWTSVEWSQLATAGTLGTSWKYSQFHLQDEVRGVHKWRNTFFDQKGNHQFKYGVLNSCSNYSDSVFSGETILQTFIKYGQVALYKLLRKLRNGLYHFERRVVFDLLTIFSVSFLKLIWPYYLYQPNRMINSSIFVDKLSVSNLVSYIWRIWWG